MKKYLSISFDKLAFGLLMLLFFALPILVVPAYNISFDISKKFFLIGVVLLATILWLIGRLEENRFTVPKNNILTASGFVGLVFLVSAVVSSSVRPSLIGLGYEQLTFFSIFVYLLLVFISSILFQNKKRLISFYLSLFVSSTIVFVFQGLRLLWAMAFSAPFPLTLFANSAVNLVGKWNDLGIFFGLIVILAVAIKELLPSIQGKSYRSFLTAVLVSALVGVAVVNFYAVWVLIAVGSLLIFVYSISFNDRIQSRNLGRPGALRLGRPVFLVFLLALSFAVVGRNDSWVSNKINNLNQQLGISAFEVRPSWGGTVFILGRTLKSDPIFGVGPNKFADQWVKNKPVGVNDTMFWNIDFNLGISFIPTVIVMTGLFGALALLGLVVVILLYGTRGLFTLSADQSSRSLTAITFVGLLYLLATQFLYTSDTVILALTFGFIGLLVAVLGESGTVKNLDISLLRDPKTSFISVIVFVVVILVSVVGGYFVSQKLFSVIAFQKAVTAFSVDNDIDKAYAAIERVNKLSAEDVYYRALTELNLLQITDLLNGPKQTEAVLADKLKAIVLAAQTNADKAINLNPDNYLNWTAKARFYEVLVPPPLAIPEAYDQSVLHYKEAIKRNPNNPAILFSLAQLEASQGKVVAAKEYLNQAIAQKRNYTNALFALAQLELDNGDIKGVIKKVEQGVFLSQNDLGLLFELGFLYYRDGNYEGAVQVLTRAISLNRDYSNARYFLGLALDRLGRVEEALPQFIEIQKLNPDNQEVKAIISNLRAGNSALYQAPAPAPEKRKEAPIKETN